MSYAKLDVEVIMVSGKKFDFTSEELPLNMIEKEHEELTNMVLQYDEGMGTKKFNFIHNYEFFSLDISKILAIKARIIEVD